MGQALIKKSVEDRPEITIPVVVIESPKPPRRINFIQIVNIFWKKQEHVPSSGGWELDAVGSSNLPYYFNTEELKQQTIPKYSIRGKDYPVIKFYDSPGFAASGGQYYNSPTGEPIFPNIKHMAFYMLVVEEYPDKSKAVILESRFWMLDENAITSPKKSVVNKYESSTGRMTLQQLKLTTQRAIDSYRRAKLKIKIELKGDNAKPSNN